MGWVARAALRRWLQAFDGAEHIPTTLMSCYDAPDPERARPATWSWRGGGSPASGGTGVGGGGGRQHTLQLPAGSTAFASTALAYELAPPAEQARLRGLAVRYFTSPPAMARRARGRFPLFGPSGLRPLAPPPASRLLPESLGSLCQNQNKTGGGGGAARALCICSSRLRQPTAVDFERRMCVR